MSDYWLTRHANALDKAERSPNAGLKAIYLQLADHYLSMHRASSISGGRAGRPPSNPTTAAPPEH